VVEQVSAAITAWSAISDEPVLLNDFRRQWTETGPEVMDAVGRVGRSGRYVLGDEVAGFEGELAAFLGRRTVVGCACGMDAIELGLRALGLGHGDRVLTTPLSAFATTLAIVRAGGVPVFVDVDEFGLVDLGQCRQVLAADRSLRFFVPVHLFGHSLSLGALEELRQEFDLRIVEDCAHALGACFAGRPVGSVGAVNALSFYPTKNLGALGDAGALFTDDVELEARGRALRDYGQVGKFRHDLLGINSRLDELHAAILRRAFLPRLGAWTERRRSIARTYLDGIRHPTVRLPGVPPGSQSVWHLFPVLVPAELRPAFVRHLDEAQVATGIHYPELINRQRALAAAPHEVLRPLSRAEEYCRCEVSLPIHPYLAQHEIQRVLDAVNGWQPR
jgi:dTDP-3-amino-3,4,6-trideoxy-alpha-D-glucose transaminase